MPRVHLIHWNSEEAKGRASRLRAAGYEVSRSILDGATLRRMGENPPAAVVIDLTRLPSQGRDVGLFLRKSKKTRRVPLVFVDGEAAKVARVREFLPDAVFTTWDRIGSALKRAIARPPADPVTPRSALDGYSGTPLPKKLGIKAHSVVALVGAPRDFEKTLGRVPEGVVLRKSPQARCDLLLWFARSRREVERRVRRMGARAGKGGLWILWQKRASGISTDLTQNVVRQVGLAAGLVDYKISAIDRTWSGLRFARRRSK